MRYIFVCVIVLLMNSICYSDPYQVVYYEAGNYSVYDETWSSTVHTLKEQGLLSKLEVREYISPGWDKPNNTHDEIARDLMSRKDIDLIISMGTVASKYILKNNNNKTPVITMALSDAKRSGIVVNNKLVARNITTRYFPNRWLIVGDTFYNLVKFKNLGLVFNDTPEGHVYANYPQWQILSKKHGFKISFRYIPMNETYGDVKEALSNLIVNSNIDAYYISSLLPFNYNDPDCVKLLQYLAENKIPTFSRDGIEHVKLGAMLGLTGTDWDSVGKFHTRQIKEILIDKKLPKEVDFIYNNRFTLALNLKTLMMVGYDSISPEYLHLFEKFFKSVEWED